MSMIEKAVTWAVDIANDNSHGYSQQIRWGASYDCSSLVISAFEQAGVSVKSAGATYTGNMKPVFLRCGFADVTSQINLHTGSGLQRGDVLLNVVNHTALYIGNGLLVHARSAEGTSDTIDNSGNEIRTQGYFNYPWDCVLRYTGETAVDNKEKESAIVPTAYVDIKLPVLRKGCSSKAVKLMQVLLQSHYYYIGIDGADGDFGNNTELALKKFQQNRDLSVDGVCGRETWTSLLS